MAGYLINLAGRVVAAVIITTAVCATIDSYEQYKEKEKAVKC